MKNGHHVRYSVIRKSQSTRTTCDQQAFLILTEPSQTAYETHTLSLIQSLPFRRSPEGTWRDSRFSSITHVGLLLDCLSIVRYQIRLIIMREASDVPLMLIVAAAPFRRIDQSFYRLLPLFDFVLSDRRTISLAAEPPALDSLHLKFG